VTEAGRLGGRENDRFVIAYPVPNVLVLDVSHQRCSDADTRRAARGRAGCGTQLLRRAFRLGRSVPLERINPANLATPQTYTHVIVATGSRLVFVAGQVAEDDQGNLVGVGDLAAQARQAFDNLGRALVAAHARPDHVAKITVFVVDYQDGHLAAIEAGRAALFGDHKPVDALVGVQALAHPGCLIEVEAIAVVDDR
jgi:enamine deaminase RidA (YjgF/YER057c/UK114 family)